MMKPARLLLPVLAACLLLVAPGGTAQPRGLAADQGYVGLGLALRQLSNTGNFMQAVAHPDDENNGLLVMLNRGEGVQTVLATATRGSGGQNEIGPELGFALGVLRTAELASVHRFDGSEQYFTRAVDFGYSFSIDETFRRWGKDQILSDFVRLIRMKRPDVIIAMRPEGTGGGQHHEASARIVGEAFRAAADPKQFPEQIQEGLRPWQPLKLFYMQGFGGRAAEAPQGAQLLRVDSEVWDPLLGATYAWLGSVARSNHKTQGMGQMFALPGPSVVTYRLGDSEGDGKGRAGSLFDGIDTTIAGLMRFARASVAGSSLPSALRTLATYVDAAQRAFASRGVDATVNPLMEGLLEVRSLRAGLSRFGLRDDARDEIDFRLKTKQEQFERALLLAQGLQFDVLADDGKVVAGQPLRVDVYVANRGSRPVHLRSVGFAGLQGAAACEPATIEAGAIYHCQSSMHVPADASLTTPYWTPVPGAARCEFAPGVPFGVPFTPTPFTAHIAIDFPGNGPARAPLQGATLQEGARPETAPQGSEVEVARDLPVQYRYEGNVFSGEKRMNLNVVPALSVRISPDITIVPLSTESATAAPPPAPAGLPPATAPPVVATNQPLPAAGREVRVSVVNGTKGAFETQISLELPEGWQSAPASARVTFGREDEARTVRFSVTPAPAAHPGAYHVKATARSTAGTFDRGYRAIEYQHVEYHQIVEPADATIKLMRVSVKPDLRVGYVMGVGDQVPAALEQLGARVDLLTSDDLAWGDLSRYDAIVTGVRAYERREDLRQNNGRLLDYVNDGGTLIVQYNKFEFNQAQYGPYPAKVSSNRVTDENAPVQVLQPSNPIFNTPNRIGPAAWQGWVQERGLYFLGDKDARYTDLVQMEDPFPYNSGVKRGALVEATFGRGHWIYVGLNLWRQLPAGTDGAYQLFANLISLR